MGCDTTALTEGRAQLKSLLAAWPDLDAGAQAALGRLPWRARRAVALVYGEGLTQRAAARRLGIGERTLRRDLYAAAKLVAGLAGMAAEEEPTDE